MWVTHFCLFSQKLHCLEWIRSLSEMYFNTTLLCLEFQRVLSETIKNIPSDEDLNGIALGLVRLQETYRLNPENILQSGLGKTMDMFDGHQNRTTVLYHGNRSWPFNLFVF